MGRNTAGDKREREERRADEIENSRLYVTTVRLVCLWKVGAPHLGAATRKVQWQ